MSVKLKKMLKSFYLTLNEKFLFFLIILSNLIFGNINYNSTFSTNYGEGFTFEKNILGEVAKKNYNYSQILHDLNIHGDYWNIFLQFDYSQPPEVGLNSNGLKRYYYNYQKDKFSVSVGDIYSSWGKGLVLSQYNDDDIAYDNGVRGVKLFLSNDKFDIEFLSGNKEVFIFSSPNIASRTPDASTKNNIVGFKIGSKLKSFQLDLMNLKSNEKFLTNSFSNDSSMATNNLSSIYGEFNRGNLDFSFEIARKQTSINPSLILTSINLETLELDTLLRGNSNGLGFAFSSNYGFGNFSTSIDYIYYDFFSSNPTFRNYFPLPEGVTQFQKPMIINQEHSSELLNRITHFQDNNDVVGMNLSLSHIGDSHSISLNRSMSSKTEEWYRSVNENMIPSKWKTSRNNYLIPSANFSSNPYMENSIIFENFFTSAYFNVTISQLEEVKILFENDKSHNGITKRYEFLKALTIPISFEYNLKNNYNLLFDITYQNIERGIKNKSSEAGYNYISSYADVDGKPVDSQDSYAINIGFSNSSKWSINFSIEKDKYDEIGGLSENVEINSLEKIFEPFFNTLDRTWIALEYVQRFDNNLRLSIFYGSNKGGYSCANGVCRYYPGFSDGLRFQLTKSIF